MVKDEVEPLGGFIGDAFVQPALLGGPGADGAGLHHHPELLARPDRRGNRRGSACHHSADAQAADPPWPRTAADGTRAFRSRRRDRRRHRRDPHQRYVELRTRRHRRPSRHDLQDPLRPLSVEVPGQVHQQLPGAGHAVPVLPRRRLVRPARAARHRPARRRHQRLQGPARTAQGTDRLGSEPSGRPGQIRAGGRAVHRRHDHRPEAGSA